MANDNTEVNIWVPIIRMCDHHDSDLVTTFFCEDSVREFSFAKFCFKSANDTRELSLNIFFLL